MPDMTPSERQRLEMDLIRREYERLLSSQPDLTARVARDIAIQVGTQRAHEEQLRYEVEERERQRSLSENPPSMGAYRLTRPVDWDATRQRGETQEEEPPVHLNPYGDWSNWATAPTDHFTTTDERGDTVYGEITSDGRIQFSPSRSRPRPTMMNCSECNTEFERRRRRTQITGEEVCRSCWLPWEYCRRCDESTLVEDLNDVEYQGRMVQVCDSCLRQHGSQCDSCERTYLSRGSRTTGLCYSCQMEISVNCNNCGDFVRRAIAEVSRDSGGFVCTRCSTSDSRRVETTFVEGGEAANDRQCLPFGVEIEAEFPFDIPFELNGYHHHALAGPEFLFRWRAETDSSLRNGGEFISPPLSGAPAMAEIFWTMDMLEENGAVMRPTCGQHITLTVRESARDYGSKVQLLTMALEEAIFAITGSFARCLHNNYCVRIKKHPTSGLLRKEVNPERRLPAYIKGRDVVEFRYPPGTLNHADFAINLGITQLIMRVAGEIEDGTLDELARRTLAFNERDGEGVATHIRVAFGLEFLRRYGWRENGDFQGLPYNPYVTTRAELQDNVHSHHSIVQFPSAEEIIARMRENLRRFYQQGLDNHDMFFSTEMREESLYIIND